VGDRELAIGGFAHGFDLVFIDGAGDDGGAVAFEEVAHFGEFFFAVFEVDGIDDALAGGELEAGLDDIELGGVDHEGGGDVFDEAGDDSVHVGDAVAADVIDADIDDVGTFFDLLAAHGGEGVDVAGEHGFLEFFGAVGVGAFADDEEREVLPGRDGGVEGGSHGGGGSVGAGEGFAWFGLEIFNGFGDELDVGGGGAAAAADDVNAEGGDEIDVGLGKFFSAEGEVGVAVMQHGEAGVGLDGEIARGLLAEGLDMLAHEFGTGGAVHAEDVDGEGFEGDDGGGHFGAEEHGAGGFHGDLNHEGEAFAFFAHGVERGGGGDFGDVEIELGLDEDGVDAAIDEAADLFRVGEKEGVVIDVAEGDGFGAGADGAGDEARLAVGEAGGGAFGDLDGGDVHFVGAVFEAELGEDDAVGAEGVGFDAIGAGGVVTGVDFLDDIGAGEDEEIDAVFLVPEIFEGEVEGEDLGAHAAVEDHDAVFEEIEEGGIAGFHGFEEAAAGGIGEIGADGGKVVDGGEVERHVGPLINKG